MTGQKIHIIDYGMGNLWSVASAFNYVGAESIITSDPEVICNAEILVLPGVGSFFKAMTTLNQSGLSESIKTAVRGRGSKILGICLGMQLFGSHGTEDGQIEGLNFIPKTVNRFTSEEVQAAKIPHIGFNLVKTANCPRLMASLPAETDFYFVHSFRMLAEGLENKSALCNYGIDFMAAYEDANIFACQFHPEKSQSNGLRVIKNFLEAVC
jgi:glutamine amidotransferase